MTIYILFVDDNSKCASIEAQLKAIVSTSTCRGVATGGTRGPRGRVPLPHFNFRKKQGPKFQFQTSRILIFTGVQELYGSKISQFLSCMLQFSDNLRHLFIL